MAFILADRVKETTVTSGTGSVTLGNGFGAFQTFADAVGDGNQTYYAIENDVRWEVGIGTYTAATNSLARDTVLRSSNSGSLISLDGVSIVFATYPADKAVAFGITNYLPDGMPLTLGRTSAGNFIHAYVDNDSDETVALHMTNESTPTWKLGLKGSPSSNTSAPTYAYVYGTTGKAGLYAASDAYVFVDSNLGFYVSHESSNLLKITKDDGSVFTNASANVNGLTIKAASAQSYPIQVWADSAGNTLSAVRENGYFAVNKSSASYPLDVNGTASMTTLRFADGSTQTTSSRSSTDFASLSGIVNSKASQTELNAVSGLILSGGTDTTYTAGSGLTLSGTTFHSSGWTVADGSGNSEAILDGQSIYFSGAGATSVTYNDSTNIVTVSGSLAAHPSVSAASSSDNSGRTYIQDITLDSNGHITGLATATETVTDTTTTYYPGSGLTVDGTTFNVSGANTSTIGIVELTNTIDSLQTKALTPKAVNDAGFLTSHPSISAGSTSNNSGRTYIQDITLDAYGHVTALGTAAETVTDTTYTAGHGLVLDGTSFNATALLTNIEGSGFSTSDTTYSAGTGLALSGTTFNASGASLSHSGVILTANIIDSNSGVAATPYAITQWAGSGLPGIDGSVISTLTEVTSADADMVMIWDADDSALKRVDAGEFRGGGGTTYTAGNGLLLDGTVFNASGASLSHSGVIKTSNTVDSNSGVAITPYAVKAVLTNIEASGFVTTDTNTTYTAGNGLILNGTTFNASGASLSHSGVIRISNTVDNNSGVAITPLAINDVLSNIESSGYLTASSTDTLTNKSIVATQLTGTIASARLPDLDVDDFAAATIQTGGEAFADSDTVLMTAAAVYNQIEAHSGTLNTAINTKQNTVTAGSGLIFSGATLNASGASLSHSGVIRTANIIDSNSGVAATPYAITQWAGSGLPGIDGSLISTLTEVTSADADMVMIWDADDSALKRVDAGEFRGGGGTTYTAGNGLLLDGTVFNASGASLSHSGVIKTSNTVDSNSGVAITPYAIKAVLTNIEGSGYITTDNNTTYTAGHGLALAGTSFSATALLTNIEGSGYIQDDSTDTLTNKSIVATQLTGTIASARLPDLAVSDFGAAAIQTGSESFADSDTVLMTAAAVYNQIEAHSGTLNTAINTKQNTVTAGSGLIFSGATLNASGASLSHPGVIRTSNTVDSNSGVAITPYAVKAVLTNIEGSGFIQADSTDTLTNKSIVATQLTGTIASDRLPDLAVSDFAGAAIQTGSESFADSDTALMTAGAVYNQIEAHSGTLNTAIGTKHDTIDASNRLNASLIGANGDVSNAEFGYLSTVSSDIQTQINTKQATMSAGHGLALDGTSFNATALLTNIEGSGYITASSTDTLTNKTLTSPDINGGTLDGATIGVSSHTTGKFTTVDATTDFTIGGTVITNNTITDDGTLIIAAATATSFSDGNITNVGDIAIDSISADGSAITISPPTTFSKSIIQPSGAITQSSSAITVDWSAGNFFTANLTATLDTVQFQNVTVGQRILLRLNQPGAAQTWTNNDSDAFRGSTATGTSNADVRWAGGGTPPTITAGTNTGDLFGFICIAEAVYDGFVVGQDIK